MYETLTDVAGMLERTVASLDATPRSAHESVRLLDVFERIGRSAAAGRLAALGSIQRTRAWQGEGHPTMAHWVAQRTGSTIGYAVGAVQTAAALAELPATRQALMAGRLSVQQAHEIALAASADPASEQPLLQTAAHKSTSELRERCRMVRVAAAGDDAHERMRRTRYFRHSPDGDGAVRLDARLAPEDVAPLLSIVHADADRRALRARRDGTREPYEAYMADALCSLAARAAAPASAPTHSASAPASRSVSAPATAGSRSASAATRTAKEPPVRAVVNVHVDLAAFERGRAEPGERCEISGVGPIPVSVARRLAAQPGGFLKLLGHEGADITKVVHVGRSYPARVQSALEARDERCAVPGCTRRRRLERDHIIEYAKGGVVSTGNISRECDWHHSLKTHHNWKIEGAPGNRTLRPPGPRSGPPPDNRPGRPPSPATADQQTRKSSRTRPERAPPAP